ncbi:MAG: ATP-dependent zinc metalloprotease FtsH [Hyphomicrobiaceae bacterium]|nr:MAG: ATP-dependent zinc metalloprotease FtsH [Hyphomicrobiaceae bacterium]
MKFDLVYFVAVIFAVVFIREYWIGEDHSKTIPYSEFRRLLDKGEVTDLVVGPTRIVGSYTKPGEAGKQHFSTVRVEPQLADELARRNIAFSGQPEPGLVANFISWLLPTAGLVLLWMLLLRPMTSGQGGLMGIGRSRAKIYAEKDIKVTFADVAGVDEAKQELAEVVGFLKDPQTHGRLGARIPKGVLLVGPPGTGKTLLARAVAGEAQVPFFSITGSEFVEMFVGVGAARVRDLFEQARAQAPAIVFIDELDALGRARGIDLPGGGHDEKEQTLNQLLAEMDGFDPSAGIIVLAATNRPEILDPALLRAGRFDRQVLVDRPDRKGRSDILRVHLSKIRVAGDLDVDAVAALTPGFTGADLANLVNEAALVATRRGAQSTTLEDFTQAIERIVAGLEKKSRILSPREREIVAHHEMGHALVAMSLPQTDPVQKVSIIPRGIAALGYTMQRPTEDRFLMSRSELGNRMAVLLGGRAAESLVFGEVSTGAADDLARATDIARSMVVRFGMTSELGQVAYEPETGTFLVGQTPMWRPRSYGDGTAEAIDHAVKGLIDGAFQKACAILERNRAILEASARELLARETLGPEDLARLTAQLDREGSTKSSAIAVVR